MIKYSNDCCDCSSAAYPCIGKDCTLINNPHYYCDGCGFEFDSDELYKFTADTILCEECLLNEFDKVT